MRKPIETVLFDFGGTLDADGVAWKERFYALYGAQGLELTAEAFQPSFFAADDALVGNLPPATDLAGTVQALASNVERELERRHGAEPNGLKGSGKDERAARVATHFLTEASAAFARNRPVLDLLRQRYGLGVVANFYGNLQGVCRGAGLDSLFAVVVDSHCVGAEKPDPAIFQVALDRLDASPETTVLVGDSLRRDGEGARRLGMRFIWMTPQRGPQAQTLSDPPVEDAVAALPELMRIFQ